MMVTHHDGSSAGNDGSAAREAVLLDALSKSQRLLEHLQHKAIDLAPGTVTPAVKDVAQADADAGERALRTAVQAVQNIVAGLEAAIGEERSGAAIE